MVLGVALFVLALSAWASVPQRAYQYQRDLTRNARLVWGLNAPVATFAAQIHQESAWLPDARSPYANGLAQFTPATADWISEAYPHELGDNRPFNPSWALRALVRYDRHLWSRVDASNECERMAFTLSSYNGGGGWVSRDRKLAEQSGADPNKWFGHVEHYSTRAKWAFEENRAYPRRILLTLEPMYSAWGLGVRCAI